ncbi:MAG TPA: prolyl oligopeptidase family serine peptidase [candidate division Zixibacteria bacterium]|nr:prolyl oligopeptidase family serine peptidase [candidate division Zixibacteria bacterium]
MKDEDYLDQILSVPNLFLAQISSNGEKIGFSWKNIHSNMDVFYIDLKNKTLPLALTNTPEYTRMLDFFPKSNSVIVCEDKSSNERERLYKINIDEPNKMIPLTEENPEYFLRWGGIHPNEKWIFYSINYDFAKKVEIEPFWIYRHNLETDERISIAQPKKSSWVDLNINRYGNAAIYSRKDLHPKGSQIWLVDIEGNEDREILNFGDKARVEALWLPDSEKIAFITDSKGKEIQKYYSFGFYDSLKEEIEWIFDDPKMNIETFSVPIIGNHLLIHEIERASVRTTIISLESMKKEIIQLKQGNLIPKFPLSKNEWIGLYYSSQQPIDLVKFNTNDITPSNFTSLINVWDRVKLSKEDFTQAVDFDWNGKDGLPIHGWLYKPKNFNGRTIIYVHGGPSAHSKDAINEQIQYYVQRGFLVLDPNYRGSTGYGYEFEDAIRTLGWGSDEQEDILAGIEALIEKGLASKEKIGITGTSYGGYSSWFAITKAPKRLVAASVPICGMTDLVIDYETTRPDLKPLSEQMLGGSPTEVPEIYFERSPINYIQNIKGSLLIVQGIQDPNVTTKNVEAVKEKLCEYEINYDLLEFEDEGHGIVRRSNQKVLFKRIADFFETYL